MRILRWLAVCLLAALAAGCAIKHVQVKSTAPTWTYTYDTFGKQPTGKWVCPDGTWYAKDVHWGDTLNVRKPVRCVTR